MSDRGLSVFSCPPGESFEYHPSVVRAVGDLIHSSTLLTVLAQGTTSPRHQVCLSDTNIRYLRRPSRGAQDKHQTHQPDLNGLQFEPYSSLRSLSILYH